MSQPGKFFDRNTRLRLKDSVDAIHKLSSRISKEKKDPAKTAALRAEQQALIDALVEEACKLADIDSNDDNVVKQVRFELLSTKLPVPEDDRRTESSSTENEDCHQDVTEDARVSIAESVDGDEATEDVDDRFETVDIKTLHRRIKPCHKLNCNRRCYRSRPRHGSSEYYPRQYEKPFVKSTGKECADASYFCRLIKSAATVDQNVDRE